MSCSLDISNSLLTIIASCKNLKLLRIAMGKVDTRVLEDAIRLENAKAKENTETPMVLEVDK